jgi:hypothetical protein
MELSVHPVPDVADEFHLPAEVVGITVPLIAVEEDPEWLLASRGGGPVHLGVGKVWKRGREDDRQQDQHSGLVHDSPA